MRLIDADAYKKELLIGEGFLDEDTLLTTINILDCAPTIEAEPVRWHSIDERPPAADVIICCRQHCELVEYGGIRWRSLFGGQDTTIARCMGVTHWRLAPDLPREGDTDAE